MPRPFLPRRAPAARKVGTTTTAVAEATSATVTAKETIITTKELPTGKSRIANAAKKATEAIGRVTRRGAAEKGRSMVEAEERGEGGFNITQESVDSTSKKTGRIARGMGKKVEVEVEVGLEEPEVKDMRDVRGKKEKVDSVIDGNVTAEETPVKERLTRSGRGRRTEKSVDPDLTPKASVMAMDLLESGVDIEDGQTASQEEVVGRFTKFKGRASKAGTKKEDKGKGRAIEEDIAENNSHLHPDVPSSPPVIPTQESTIRSLLDQDDLSSTSSIYGDENFLPPPLAQSTPKVGTLTSLPVTPPKAYRSSQGYTPPPPPSHRTADGAGPSTVAGPSMGNHSPVRRRLWESSPTPHPLSQCETPKTAAVVEEAPLGFDIYEDSSPTKFTKRPDLSRAMDVDRDARGDGAGSNILRTPKRKVLGLEMATKRTGTGTKKSPDGKIIEEDESESSDDSDSSSLSGEETPKPVPVEAKPKRQKRVQPETVEPILTKDLLDLAPRRRRTGKARTTRNKAPVVDDLGEDVTGEIEEEISLVVKKRAGAAKKGGKMVKEKGTTVTKKAQAKSGVAKGKGKTTAAASRATETPVKDRRAAVSQTPTVMKPGRRTYGRQKSIGDNGSDSSLTPVPADKENEFSMSLEPSSEIGTDEAGVTKDGRKKLRQIKTLFEEVDKWEMEFEDVSVEASSDV